MTQKKLSLPGLAQQRKELKCRFNQFLSLSNLVCPTISSAQFCYELSMTKLSLPCRSRSIRIVNLKLHPVKSLRKQHEIQKLCRDFQFHVRHTNGSKII